MVAPEPFTPSPTAVTEVPCMSTACLLSFSSDHLTVPFRGILVDYPTENPHNWQREASGETRQWDSFELTPRSVTKLVQTG